MTVSPPWRWEAARGPSSSTGLRHCEQLRLVPKDILYTRDGLPVRAGRLFPFNPNALDKHWERQRTLLGHADDPEWVWHTFRHTYGTRLIQRGKRLEDIAKLMGHSSLQVTLRYAKISPANLYDAIQVLDDD